MQFLDNFLIEVAKKHRKFYTKKQAYFAVRLLAGNLNYSPKISPII